MSRLKIGDRVCLKSSGELATVVEHISQGFVGIRYDQPHEAVNMYGRDYSTLFSCCHVDLLEPEQQGRLL